MKIHYSRCTGCAGLAQVLSISLVLWVTRRQSLLPFLVLNRELDFDFIGEWTKSHIRSNAEFVKKAIGDFVASLVKKTLGNPIIFSDLDMVGLPSSTPIPVLDSDWVI